MINDRDQVHQLLHSLSVDSNTAAAFCDSFTGETFLAELATGQIDKDMKAA